MNSNFAILLTLFAVVLSTRPVNAQQDSTAIAVTPDNFHSYIFDATECLEYTGSEHPPAKVYFMFHISAEGVVDSAEVFYPKDVYLPDSCHQKLLEMPNWKNPEKKPVRMTLPVHINLW